MGAKRYASNAERQRAYRERKRNGDGVTDNRDALRNRLYSRSMGIEPLELLMQIAERGGEELAWLAVEAIERAIANERAWAAIADWDRTTQGYNLKLLVKRKDPRVQQFLEDCKYLA